MNPYKKLAKNSIIFAIGNFGSKLISLILVPLYTFYLSTGQYGTVDLVTTTVALIVPIITLSISDAVLRFVMDNNSDKNSVLSNGVCLIIIGLLISLVFYPIFKTFFPFREYINLFYLFLLTQSLNGLFLQFTRAVGKVNLFAGVGIISSIVVLGGNIIFLVILKMGITGYLLSLISADVASLIIIMTVGSAIRYVDFQKINISLLRKMIIYSLPLMPTTLMWWVLNLSGRFIISFFVGVAANGLFAVATKIPNVLNVLSNVFFQAWQMSAIEEINSKNKSLFFSNVYMMLSSIMFIAMSFILIVLKWIMGLIVSAEFYDAWNLVPFLLMGVVFSSFASFFGQIYVANKNTVGVFKTSFLSALINVIINFILVPFIGTIGASVSMMVSFAAMWLMRVIDTNHFVTIDIKVHRTVTNLLILFLQIFLLYIPIPLQVVFQSMLFCIILLLNKDSIKICYKKVAATLEKRYSK
ncbi:oligosaccharide flippase family protein [Sporolactobacillus sp. Y61]|uniref:Oligosaccharide flippase family protein n=1 Tax=Sporolactobacillus sp. Y61 TaxID=3160863 RepID=A0AAU8IIH7_9BACL